MKKKVKIIMIAAVALLCAGGAAVSMLMPMKVDAVVLEPRTATLTFTEQGSYDYDRSFQVYPLVAGEVLEVRAKEGQRVNAGDVLAVINASDYEYQITGLQSAISGYSAQISNLALQEQQRRDTLSTTLANLEGQQAELKAEMENRGDLHTSLQAQVSFQENIVRQDRSNINLAEDNLDWADENGTEYDVTTARQALNAARQSYNANRILLEQLRSGETPEGVMEGQWISLQSQIDTILIQINKDYSGAMTQYYSSQISASQANIAQMQEKTGQASIVAPVSGVIRSLPVQDLNLVAQQSCVAVIASGEQVEVFVPIREIDAVREGDTVQLLLDKRLGTETISGTVFKVEDQAQVKLSALGVEERKVRVLIRPEGKGLRIGYDMDVRFTVYTRENAVVVPKTAVFNTPEGDWVWLIRDGVLQQRQIAKGVALRDGYIVEEGLAQGDTVVTDANDSSLKAGKRAAISAA